MYCGVKEIKKTDDGGECIVFLEDTRMFCGVKIKRRR